MPGAMPNGGGPSSMQGLGPGGPSNAMQAAATMPNPQAAAAQMNRMRSAGAPPAVGGMSPIPPVGRGAAGLNPAAIQAAAAAGPGSLQAMQGDPAAMQAAAAQMAQAVGAQAPMGMAKGGKVKAGIVHRKPKEKKAEPSTDIAYQGDAAPPAPPVPPPAAGPIPAMKKGGSCDKMAMGGIAKARKGFPNTEKLSKKKMAKGGKVRGCGIASKGTSFSGIY